jgi:hypothetical protein
MILLLVHLATAAPTYAALAGGGVITGESGDRSYASWSPMVAGTVDWRFAFVETWLGLSGSGFVAPNRHDDPVPAALLQGEFGLGLGSPVASAGAFFGAGLSGAEGGLYGRVMFDGPAWAQRLGGELRAFHLGQSDAGGVVLFLRAEFGPADRRRPPPPVHHDDPYTD